MIYIEGELEARSDQVQKISREVAITFFIKMTPKIIKKQSQEN